MIRQTAESKGDIDRALWLEHLYTRRHFQLQERWLARQIKQSVCHLQVGKVARPGSSTRCILNRDTTLLDTKRKEQQKKKKVAGIRGEIFIWRRSAYHDAQKSIIKYSLHVFILFTEFHHKWARSEHSSCWTKIESKKKGGKKGRKEDFTLNEGARHFIRFLDCGKKHEMTGVWAEAFSWVCLQIHRHDFKTGL